MFQLKLSAQTLLTASGSVARVTDLTDWSQASNPRAAWALFLSVQQLGTIQADDRVVTALAYEPHLFQSVGSLPGTVEVVLPTDGVFRLQAVAVPVLADAAQLALATTGRVYYRLDTQQFTYKLSSLLASPVTSWSDILSAASTDNGELTSDVGNLLDKSAEAYTLATAELQAGLAKLNLRYLEAGNRSRTLLQHEYSQVDLLLSGAARQIQTGFYADASTTLTAAQRLLGACLPGYAQSLPAIEESDCGAR